MSPLADLYQFLAQWGPIFSQIGQALVGLVAVIGGTTIALNYAASRRDEIRLKQEQWRISYRNLQITNDLVLTHTASAPQASDQTLRAVATGTGTATAAMHPSAPASELSQFLIFRLKVENIGDGPVDVWACLVAARELNAGDHRESWGGNIEWNDLDAYYFDAKPEWQHLAGISNTQHSVYSQDDYIQLDPHQQDTLTRIDRIEPVNRDLTLLYRVFLVGRGYGGTQEGTPQRDVLAWQRLQQAMFNISGPSFRMLFDVEDPLDLVADRDGWQCFVLYHSAFTDDVRDLQGWTHIDRLNGQLEGEWGRTHSEQEARDLCAQQLAAEAPRWRRHWEAFKQAVAECKRLPNGFSGLIRTGWRPTALPEAVQGRPDPAGKRASEAFNYVPRYLKWDPNREESLPIWESFILATLKVEGPSVSVSATASSPTPSAVVSEEVVITTQ